MLQHEVGQDTGGAAGHPHLTVHQDFPTTGQCCVYKLCYVIEVESNVGLRNIQQSEPLVSNAPWLIKLLEISDLVNMLMIIFEMISFSKSYLVYLV